jgi:PhzF family phenazine biosynthesis protein
MELKIYQADAFADAVFSGNPAAVIPLGEWLPDSILQKIALENNLSETTFFVDEPEGLRIRWFTPAAEVRLCGHATLASAHILFNHLGFAGDVISFNSLSGVLKIERSEGLLWLDFPASELRQVEIPANLTAAVGCTSLECWRGRDDFMLVFDSEETIRSISPDFQAILKSECRGLIVTAPGQEVDFVSRFFAPRVGVNEDPVTGSAHTMLIPYWSKKLSKTEMQAQQVSKRGGSLQCLNLGNRVKIGGKAVTYLEGRIWV